MQELRKHRPLAVGRDLRVSKLPAVRTFPRKPRVYFVGILCPTSHDQACNTPANDAQGTRPITFAEAKGLGEFVSPSDALRATVEVPVVAKAAPVAGCARCRDPGSGGEG